MAFALVGSGVHAGDVVGGAGPVTTGTYDTSGASLIVVIQSGWNAYVLPTLSDSKSNSWTYLTSKSAGNVITRIAYAENPTVGTGHTFTNTGGFYTSLCVLAFSGSAVAAVFDVQNGATTAGATSLAAGSITPSADNELIISGYCLADVSSGYAVTASMTIQQTSDYDGAGASFGSIIAYKIQGALAAINPTWSWNDSYGTGAVIAAFKPTNPPGTTYYVATTGNDANPGTSGSPFLTISKGVSVLVAGDVLYIRAGTYSGGINTIDSQTYTVPSGSSGAPITIGPYPGDTVTIQPPDLTHAIRLTSTGGPRSYLIFQDLILDGLNHVTDGAQLFFMSGGCADVTLLRCEVKRSFSFGVVTSTNNGDCPRFLVKNCLVHDNGDPAGPQTNGHGLYIQSSAAIVEGCTIFNNQGYGLNTNAGADDAIYRKNRIYNNGARAATTAYNISVSHSSNEEIANNLVYQTDSRTNLGGILIYTGSLATKAYNNTVYKHGYNGISMEFYGSAPTLTNNIVYSNLTNIDDQGGTGTPVQTTNFTTDPTFVNAGTFDLHLQSTSGAKTGGTTLASVTTDFDGVSRPQGATYARGAYEFVAPTTAARLVFRRH